MLAERVEFSRRLSSVFPVACRPALERPPQFPPTGGRGLAEPHNQCGRRRSPASRRAGRGRPQTAGSRSGTSRPRSGRWRARHLGPAVVVHCHGDDHGAADDRPALGHRQALLDGSKRRACRVIAADRSVIRYQSRRDDEGMVRAKLRDLAHQRCRFGDPALHILLCLSHITPPVRPGWPVGDRWRLDGAHASIVMRVLGAEALAHIRDYEARNCLPGPAAPSWGYSLDTPFAYPYRRDRDEQRAAIAR